MELRIGLDKRIQTVSKASQQYLHNLLTVIAFKHIGKGMKYILCCKNLPVFC